MDNIWLVLIALASGFALVWPLIAKRMSGIPEVGAMEAVQLINRKDAIVLDVREPAEFSAGHVPNARNLPLSQFDKRVGEIAKFKGKPVIVACQSGSRSHAANAKLKAAGFTEIFVLAGGIGAWQQANLPVEK
jgi:rhodanese-related sulfurtransferase